MTTTTAEISGEVNPRGLLTTVAVQYVTQAQFEAGGYAGASETAGEEVGSGSGFLEVSQQLTGLAPLTAYHFRLVAENEAGAATPGEDGTFTTFVEASGLPEGRAWEQVSPAVKLGEVFPTGGQQSGFSGSCKACTPGWEKGRMPMQVSPDGNAISYEGNPFSKGLASGRNEYIGNRGAGGWATTPLSGPEYGDSTGEEGFRAFSADLSRGVLYQESPALSPDAPPGYPDLYLWQAGGDLTPLITSEPPNRSPGGENEERKRVPPHLRRRQRRHRLGTPLQPRRLPGQRRADRRSAGNRPRSAAGGESGNGKRPLRMVGRPASPRQRPARQQRRRARRGDRLGKHAERRSQRHNRRRPRDLRRRQPRLLVAKPSGQVYVREGAASTTKVPDPGKFLTATPDGSKVLLSDGVVFNLEDESTEDLTGGQGGFQGTPRRLGRPLARSTSSDTKALTPPGQENANGEHAEEGKSNLYLAEGGVTTFITILPGLERLVSLAVGPHGPGQRRRSLPRLHVRREPDRL